MADEVKEFEASDPEMIELDAKLLSSLKWAIREIDEEMKSTREEFKPLPPYVPEKKLEEPNTWFWVLLFVAGASAVAGAWNMFHPY